MTVIKCCKGCDKRLVRNTEDGVITCHSTCEKYIEEKTVLTAERKALQKEEIDRYRRKMRYYRKKCT